MGSIEFMGCVLAIGIASFLIFIALSEIRAEVLLSLRGVEIGSNRAYRSSVLIERVASLVALKLLPLKGFQKLVNLCGGADELEIKVWRAGLDHRFDAYSLVAFRLMVLLSILLFAIIILGVGLFGAILSILFGWLFSGIWIQMRERRRSRSIEMTLPAMLDQLALSVCAGMDFMQAIGRVVEGSRDGPLKCEMKRFISSVGMGVTRSVALEELSGRSNVASLISITSLLIQADRLGTSVGPVLRASAQRLRDDRLTRAEKRGAAAAQKALIPLVFCIMPATFIIIFGPLVARFIVGGLESFF